MAFIVLHWKCDILCIIKVIVKGFPSLFDISSCNQYKISPRSCKRNASHIPRPFRHGDMRGIIISERTAFFIQSKGRLPLPELLDSDQLPLLISPAIRGPLNYRGTSSRRGTSHIGVEATALVDYIVVAIACRDQVPPLIRAIGVIPLIQLGSIGL